MKKNWLLLLTIFFSLGLGFTSCGDDDDDPIVEETVFGAYKGTMNITLEGTGLPGMDDFLKDIPQKIYLDKVGENKAKFLLKDFSFGPMSFGNIEIKSADIRNTGSEYKVNGTDKVELASIGTCDVDLDGTIVGEKINWTVNVNVIAGDLKGLKVNVKFSGTKLAADQSSEAEILTFEFDPKVAEANKLVTKVDIQDNKISLRVNDEATEEDLKKLVPTITISDKATLSPESGKAQDFNKAVVYTVTSEDGITKNKYTVSIASSFTFFDFEEWKEENTITIGHGDYKGEKRTSYKPSSGQWATSNDGAAFIMQYSLINSFIVTPLEKGGIGESIAARITTTDRAALAGGNFILDMIEKMAPYVTSGTLFLGNFELNASNPLKSTSFGVPYDKKPITLKFAYKYTPGEVYYEVVKEINKPKIVDKKDECAIRAILYEPKVDNKGNPILLNGETVDTEKDDFIASVEFFNSGQGELKEETHEFVYHKEYDVEKSDKYHLAIIFSSSKDGARYNGAPGSELIIDNVEIINEK